MITIHNTEAWNWLQNVEESEKWDMIFMDPPDNIGLIYGEGIDDRKSKMHYLTWLQAVLMDSIVLAPVVWVSYYHKYDLEIKRMINWLFKWIKPTWECRTFIWRFTFGQYRETDCGSGYRPILRLSSPGVKWQTNNIRIRSTRQILGDSRAKGPKVPDDVWDFPRVVGNSPERRKWIPTQHPEGLINRIVKLSLPGKEKPKVLELFTGSGTMIRVIKRLNISRVFIEEIDLDTVELSKEYIDQLVKEHPSVKVIKCLQ